MKITRSHLAFVFFISVFAAFGIFGKNLWAAPIDVTNTNDAGAGTLRQAILDSNASAGVADTITFHIGGGGVQTITLLSALPILTDPVTIDGTTQPGFTGAPLIELNVNNSANIGIDISAADSMVQGLIINRALNTGIQLNGALRAKIKGNFIGTDVTGTKAVGSQVNGIDMTNNSNNAVIGGTNGVTPVGPCTGDCNLISGHNTGTAIEVGFGGSSGVTGTVIQGNKIGTQVDGVTPLGNRYGIFVSLNSTNITIGGPTPAEGNVIAFNAGGAPSSSGVIVLNGSTGVSIRGNSIFSNEMLGIDLGNTGVVKPNDVMDPDLGPNLFQNFPLLSSATIQGCSTTVQGTLNSIPNMVYTLDFYSNPPTDPNEGKVYLGFSTTAATDSNGDVSFTATLPISAMAGNFVTATATDLNNNTSEFSLGVAVTGTTNPNVGTLQFNASNYSVNENGGNATITVTRTGGSNCPVTVAYATSDGTAIAGSDYTATSGVLNWADGDTADKTFTIPILDDTSSEADETVNLALSQPTGGAGLGTPNTALLTIVDDDSGLFSSGGGCSLSRSEGLPLSFLKFLPFLSVACLWLQREKRKRF